MNLILRQNQPSDALYTTCLAHLVLHSKQILVACFSVLLFPVICMLILLDAEKEFALLWKQYL